MMARKRKQPVPHVTSSSPPPAVEPVKESPPVPPPLYPAGVRFAPEDEDLLVHYLTRKVRNLDLPCSAVKQVNFYNYHPRDLVEKYKQCGEGTWYFFTPRYRKYPNGNRPNRSTAQDGFWKSSGKVNRIKNGDGEVIGYNAPLVYWEGKQPKGIRTDWLMHEYTIDESRLPINHVELDTWVICKVYNKNSVDSDADDEDRDDDYDNSQVHAFDNHDLENYNHSNDCEPHPEAATQVLSSSSPGVLLKEHSFALPVNMFGDHRVRKKVKFSNQKDMHLMSSFMPRPTVPQSMPCLSQFRTDMSLHLPSSSQMVSRTPMTSSSMIYSHFSDSVDAGIWDQGHMDNYTSDELPLCGTRWPLPESLVTDQNSPTEDFLSSLQQFTNFDYTQDLGPSSLDSLIQQPCLTIENINEETGKELHPLTKCSMDVSDYGFEQFLMHLT